MESSVVEAATLAGAMAEQDLSMYGLFMRADIVVKSVMLMLVLASIWCWAIIFDKWARLRRLNKAANEFENKFWSQRSMADLGAMAERMGNAIKDPMSAVFATAMREWQRYPSRAGATIDRHGSVADRVERVMHITVAREMERVERNMTFLASTGATAPFIGLFGTVWGIMNSFQAIAISKNTSLAVVAPGIAEALFATALGLVAAIPAVVAYNKLSKDLDRYASRLETFAGEFVAIIARQGEEAN